MPLRGSVDFSDASRKQVFLLLENERRWLAARLRPRWRPGRRYEDLSLVVMLARLERDLLGQRLADWARPWGTAPRTKLEADIDHHGDALKRLGRWLPMQTIAKAEDGARRRLAAITAGLEEPGPRAWTAVPSASPGPAPDTPRFEPPWRARVAAVAALLLLGTVTGALLLLAGSEGSDPDSVGRAGAGPRPGGNQHATNVQIPGRSAQGRPGPGRPGDSEPQSNARASSEVSAPSTSVASEPVLPPPEPPPVAEPVAAPQVAPAPVPAGSPPSPPSSQAKDVGGCPPEFGYEC